MSATSPSPAAARAPARRRGAAAFVAAGILLSRIAGLVRERVMAHYLGNSAAAGAFKAALRIPNFLQNLFGEGVLSASFIPVYSRVLAAGAPDVAGQVAGVVFAILGSAVCVIVALGVLATPFFVDLVAPGFHGEVRALTVHLVQILFPGVGLLVMSAWCLGVLNSHRRFFLSYVAPVFWNLAMITALVREGMAGNAAQDRLAVALAWGSVAGSLLQFGLQLPFVFRCNPAIRPCAAVSLAPVREVFRNLGPVVLSRGVVQLSAYIDGMIASFLGAGAVASLAYAQTIYLLPIGLFGMSVAAAELPEMSSAQGDETERNAKLRTRLLAGRRGIAFFVIPSVAAFLFVGRQIVAALYQTGQFGADDTLYVWYILMGSTVGLLAATWGRLYSSAFYALRDPRTPLRFAIVRVTLTAVLGLLFAFPLRPLLSSVIFDVLRLPMPRTVPDIELAMGAVGLTSSAGLAGWIEFLLLQRALGRRIGLTPVPREFQLRVWGAAIVGALVAWAFRHFALAAVTHGHALRLLRYDLSPLLVIAVYGAAFLLVARALGIEEVARVTSRFRKR